MKDDAIWAGVSIVIALISIPVLVWPLMALFLADDGCAWIIGIGECLPR